MDLLYKADLQPCPGKCAMSFEKFDVSGVPDAKGVRRYVTTERLEELQEQGEPSDSYTIVFVDGPYAYNVELFGPGRGLGGTARRDRREAARPGRRRARACCRLIAAGRL